MDASTFLIPIHSSFSFEECLWFLHRNFDDCLHTVGSDYVRKALVIEGNVLLLDISQKENDLLVHILKGSSSPEVKAVITAYIHDWFDLEKDITPFYQLLNQQSQLSYMANDFLGLRLIGIPDLFEALCWAIIGQQINLTFAFTLKRRLVEKYGSRIEYGQDSYYVFPTAEVLADAPVEDLRAMQFSGKKAEYLIGVAQTFANGAISRKTLLDLPDVDARQKALTSLKGIGIWTANYALMKSLREPSSIPYGDAGLLNALVRHQVVEGKTQLEGMEKLFKDFAGWESYLVFYLWRSLSKKE